MEGVEGGAPRHVETKAGRPRSSFSALQQRLESCLKISKFFFPIKLRERVEKYPQAIIKCPRRAEMQSEGNAVRVLNRFNAIARV